MSFIFGDKPTPPDPTQTANAQQGYNINAAKTQNQVNSYGQSNPYGNLNYVADPNSPSGYRINTTLSAPMQQTFDTQTGTINKLAGSSGGMYSSPYDLDAASTGTAKLLNNWSSNYVQPIFDRQSSNLEGQLRNMGLAPGSEAYNNAKNLLARNQGDVTNQFLQQNQGQAFDQALKAYQTPLDTIRALQSTLPGNPTFAQSPTAQIQPANYAGIAEQNYQSQMQDYQNNVNNIGKLGVAGMGLLAAPFTGGTSLAATGMGMFGNAVGNTMAPSGGFTGWTKSSNGGWG